jgi:hypothetical protein
VPNRITNSTRVRRKCSIIVVMLLSTLLCKSQTIEWLYYLNGHYVIMVTSPCSTDMRIHWNRGGLVVDTIIPLEANKPSVVHLPGEYTPGVEIRMKSDAQCSTTGWITFTIPIVLALPDRPKRDTLKPKLFIYDRRLVIISKRREELKVTCYNQLGQLIDQKVYKMNYGRNEVPVTGNYVVVNEQTLRL